MQQCRFVYTITRADCRACNGLDAGCRNYEPNPDEKAWRETDAEAKRQLPRKLFPPCEVNSLKLQHADDSGCFVQGQHAGRRRKPDEYGNDADNRP